ncbi:unnamed protein product [Symbiodinium natans]|uniref:Uncharacterized protein n=1 Tax=Symbiodinium natans TaxID=878477 RepID=A0A812P5X2_9DINO|nr:unnamed protein product [Symbiodinium natans]
MPKVAPDVIKKAKWKSLDSKSESEEGNDPYRHTSNQSTQEENESRLEQDVLAMLKNQKQVSNNLSECNFCQGKGHKAAACLKMIQHAISHKAGLFSTLRWSKLCRYCFRVGKGKRGRANATYCPEVVGKGWAGHDEKTCWHKDDVEKAEAEKKRKEDENAEAQKSKFTEEEGERAPQSPEKEDEDVTELMAEANAEARKKQSETKQKKKAEVEWNDNKSLHEIAKEIEEVKKNEKEEADKIEKARIEKASIEKKMQKAEKKEKKRKEKEEKEKAKKEKKNKRKKEMKKKQIEKKD